MEGSNAAANSVSCCALLTRAAVGPQPLVNEGVRLGTAACPPADSATGRPALAADPSMAFRLPRHFSVALASCPCQAQTKPQLRSCKSWSPDGLLPCRLAQPAGLVSAQTCQTHSQHGWPCQGAIGNTGHSGSNSSRLSSSSNLPSSPISATQTEPLLMTPWMC